MKKIIHLIILVFIIHVCLPVSLSAQADIKAQIEDVLVTFPAQNKQQLDKSMQAITALGEKGIAAMASGFTPAGAGDNTALEYAIGSYSTYVTQPGKEELRHTAVLAYSLALNNLHDNTARQFIIKQLQQMGKDDAVPVLNSYLADVQLSGPAARALAQIKTPAAESVLQKALTASDGAARQSIIEALGYAGYGPAFGDITYLANSTNASLRRVCLYALARFGVPVSATLLYHAAEEAGYTYDSTEAVSAYILYLHTFILKEKTYTGIAHASSASWVLKAVLELHKHADEAGQVHTKIAALELLTEIDGSSSMVLLEDALKDNNTTYRAAALGFATKFQSPETDREWLRLLPSLAPAAQVQVIDFLAQTGDAALLPGVGHFLTNKDEAVKIAAIRAVGKLGGKAALPLLLAVMQTGNSEEIAAAKNALFTLKTNDISAPIIRVFPAMGNSAKVALLQVLAARSAGDAAELVFGELQSADTAVHKAAVIALAAVVSQQDLPKLFVLLNSARANDVDDLQQAVIEASSNIKDTAARAYAILTALKAAPAGVQYRYFNVLVATGGKTVLDEVQVAYENGNATTKAAAVSALAKTNSATAARILLHIAQQAADETALNGYISIIQNSAFPADQKLLMLKEAMAAAKTVAQRKSILQEAGECKTFLSLIFAGKFLDDAPVQQEAAHAVMDIALSHSEYNGDIVKKLLTKTMEVLHGTDADYERQSIKKYLASMPAGDGFVSMFNGTDLTGWKGLVANPIARAKMNPDTLAAAQAKADKVMRDGWFAKDGLLVFGGNGENLCTVKQYGDFEMYVDWKITKEGDAGIYLRGSPQVQIWDTSRISVGAQVGSGGLYNNQKNRSTPLVLADNAIGEWNSFHIIMRGDKVTVYLNGVLVTDNIVLENYWDRSLPIFVKEQIELQAHGTYVAYRDLYIKELTDSPPYVLTAEEKKEGYSLLFNGSDISQWTGNTQGYSVNQGSILVDTADGHPGNLYTKQQYSNFVLRFEFQLTPGANNGIGIRAPLEGDAAYVGMEIQVLDNEAPEYKDLHTYQYHGSVYGVIPAKRGFLKPTGEWNYEEITANGPHIKVVLNGEVILDGNIDEASKNGTADKREHPGLHRPTGHVGFLGHGSVVRFRNLRIKEL